MPLFHDAARLGAADSVEIKTMQNCNRFHRVPYMNGHNRNTLITTMPTTPLKYIDFKLCLASVEIKCSLQKCSKLIQRTPKISMLPQNVH